MYWEVWNQGLQEKQEEDTEAWSSLLLPFSFFYFYTYLSPAISKRMGKSVYQPLSDANKEHELKIPYTSLVHVQTWSKPDLWSTMRNNGSGFLYSSWLQVRKGFEIELYGVKNGYHLPGGKNLGLMQICKVGKNLGFLCFLWRTQKGFQHADCHTRNMTKWIGTYHMWAEHSEHV